MKRFVAGFLLFLVMVSCNSGGGARDITVYMRPALIYGEYLHGHEDIEPNMTNHWANGEYTLHVYVVQNGSFYSAGKAAAWGTSDEKGNRDSFAQLDFTVPSSVNMDKPFSILALDNDAGDKLTGNSVSCEAPLKRKTSHLPAWYVAQYADGHVTTSQAYFVAASECLYVNNTSGKAIKVKHCGWENGSKWYYTDAKVKFSASADGVVTSASGSVGSGKEASTEKVDVKVGEEAFIISRFVPSGTKLQNSVLVLEIDGKEVKSPPLSSESVLKNGTPYYASIIWDGTSLKWED